MVDGVWLCVLYRLITSVLFLQFLSYTAFTTNEVMETMGAGEFGDAMGQLFKYERGTLREMEGGRRCTRGRFG
ncbi:hypothetical protein NC651_012269 [Populus alba x Populus x berolinensis]|nr:hypothetical protein NC651_012269 [Populus alba x Populus x berolinensis]